MNLNNVNKALNDFGKYVIQQSKSNLTKDNKGSGDLYNSLRYTLDDEQKGFILDFYMENYGSFQDQGVKGAKPSLIKNGKQKAPSSKFSYKQKMPPMQMLADWAKSKNLRFRDKEGKFKKGSYRSMGFVLQRSIYAQGLKPNYFFTKPFEAAFKRLPKELLQGFALDIEKGIILGTKK